MTQLRCARADVCLKGRPAYNGMEQHGTRTPHVGCLSLRSFPQNFGSHGLEGPRKVLGGVRGIRSPTKVSDLQNTIRGHEEVLKLDVSMDYTN